LRYSWLATDYKFKLISSNNRFDGGYQGTKFFVFRAQETWFKLIFGGKKRRWANISLIGQIHLERLPFEWNFRWIFLDKWNCTFSHQENGTD